MTPLIQQNRKEERETKRMKQQYDMPCNIAQTLNIIGDKWTLLIINQIMKGKDTYTKISDGLEKIPSNLLSSRLKSLEKDKIIEVELYQKHPPRYRYTLTNSGKDLSIVLHSLIMWGEKHLDECHKSLIHKECNHKVELQHYCCHCNKLVDGKNVIIK